MRLLMIMGLSLFIVVTFLTNSALAADGGTRKVFKDCPDCPEMVEIPAGNFMMGDKNYVTDMPVHRVTFKKPFALGKTEVTQGQWKAIMGSNPSFYKTCGDTCPITTVSLDEIAEFIKRLSTKTGKQYRLPSESEWEYACLAGKQTTYCGSNDSNTVAWTANNSPRNIRLHSVAQKQPNAWGLYDMSGNVSEYVADISIIFANQSNGHHGYHGYPTDGSALLKSSATINSSISTLGDTEQQIHRGGSTFAFDRARYRDSVSKNMNVEKRYTEWDESRSQFGFRLARTLP